MIGAKDVPNRSVASAPWNPTREDSRLPEHAAGGTPWRCCPGQSTGHGGGRGPGSVAGFLYTLPTSSGATRNSYSRHLPLSHHQHSSHNIFVVFLRIASSISRRVNKQTILCISCPVCRPSACPLPPSGQLRPLRLPTRTRAPAPLMAMSRVLMAEKSLHWRLD